MRMITAWLLIGGFLLQPILTYLVTPIVAHDAQGQEIAICTLQGEKRILVDIPQLADNEDTEHCSALKLYQIASVAWAYAAPAVPAISLYVVELVGQTAVLEHRKLHFSAYPTRAPPIV